MSNPAMRFRLRALLAGTTGLALLAAIAGHFYRAARPEIRDNLLALWSSALVVFLGYLAARWWGRVQRIHAAGAIRYALPRRDLRNLYYGLTVVTWGSLLLLSLAMLAWTSTDVGHSLTREPVAGACWAGTIFGFLFTAAAHFLYRPIVRRRPLYLCEHGVIAARRMLPWTSFQRVEWSGLHPKWLMLRTWWERCYAAEAPADLRDEIEAFVSARTEFRAKRLAPGH